MSIIRNELQLEQSQAADHEQRANDLEQIMESVKSKIDELEDESLNRVCQQQNIIKDLQKEHKALQVIIIICVFIDDIQVHIIICVFIDDSTKTAH